MALQFYKGQQIGGGGTTVLPMTQAEYLANKTVLDASDFLIDITDEPDQLAYADEIGYGDTNMGYIGDVATNAIAEVELTNTASQAYAVGDYLVNKDGKLCRVTSAIQSGQTITTGTNCVLTSVGNKIKQFESKLVYQSTTHVSYKATSANWEYTGASITVPANHIYLLTARQLYNSGPCLGLAISNSSNTLSCIAGTELTDAAATRYVFATPVGICAAGAYYIWEKRKIVPTDANEFWFTYLDFTLN